MLCSRGEGSSWLTSITTSLTLTHNTPAVAMPVPAAPPHQRIPPRTSTKAAKPDAVPPHPPSARVSLEETSSIAATKWNMLAAPSLVPISFITFGLLF